MITLLYRIYQFIICLPGIVLMTIITAIEVGLKLDLEPHLVMDTSGDIILVTCGARLYSRCFLFQ